MGVRTNVEIAFQIGRENSLTNIVFDSSMQQLLDTLEHTESGTFSLDAGETNYQIPFGDVVQSRLVYIEATGPFRVTPGGGLATSAQRDGAGGSYPTGFAGVGETLDLVVDGTAFTVTFTAADQSLAQVINRINAAAALAGIAGVGGIPTTVARDTGGSELRIISPLTGTSSTVEVAATSAAAVLTALGLVAGTTTGVAASPGQTPLTALVPSSSAAGGPSDVRAFLFASLVTGALTIDNLDSEAAITVTVALAGDLLTSPPTDC